MDGEAVFSWFVVFLWSVGLSFVEEAGAGEEESIGCYFSHP